jgi:putative transposase
VNSNLRGCHESQDLDIVLFYLCFNKFIDYANLGGYWEFKGIVMNKPRNFYKGTFHHLYNRGVNKERIFFSRDDYLYFLRKLKFYNNIYQIRILAYCLMPNHFHLFVEQLTDDLKIGKFISDTLNSYTKSTNTKYERRGTLFESKTKSKMIENEEHFIWLIKYILDNPLKSGLSKTIEDWEFSNAKDLLGLRNGTLSDITTIKSYFASDEELKRFLVSEKEINFKI